MRMLTGFAFLFTLLTVGSADAAKGAKIINAPTTHQAFSFAAKRYPNAKITPNADITASGKSPFLTKRIAGTEMRGRLIAIEPANSSKTAPFVIYVTKSGKFFGKDSGDL
jgi:hypothetical protein